tara:strand:- start:37 stop:531 length:495 start_codon:yes stop_codon:yes gene_type:complete
VLFGYLFDVVHSDLSRVGDRGLFEVLLVLQDLLLEKLLLPHHHIVMNVRLIVIHQVHRLVVHLQLAQVLAATIIELLEPILGRKPLFRGVEFLELLVLEVFGRYFAVVTLYGVAQIRWDLVAFFGSDELILVVVLSDYVVHVYHLLRCFGTPSIVRRGGRLAWG